MEAGQKRLIIEGHGIFLICHTSVHTGQGRSQKKISGAIINFSYNRYEFQVGMGIINFEGREFQREKIDKMINVFATESG